MKIAMIGSGLTNLLIAAKLANDKNHQIDIYEKSLQLGGSFKPFQISENQKIMITNNLFIDEENMYELLKGFGITLPISSTLSLHRLYAIQDQEANTYSKYRNVNETIESLKVTDNHKLKFRNIYREWLVKYNTMKAYATNDISKPYYQRSLFDIIKDSYSQSFFEEAGKINSEQFRNLYSVSPILLGLNPSKLNRQNQYISVQEHKKGVSYFNRANTDLYDNLILKIELASNIKVINETVLNVFQNSVILDEKTPKYDVIIDGTSNYTYDRQYQHIGLESDKILLYLNKTYANMPTNLFILNSDFNNQIKNKKNYDQNSIFIHNPFRMQNEIEKSVLIISLIGNKAYSKLEIQNSLIPLLEEAGFYEASKNILNIFVVKDQQKTKKAEDKKNIFKNKMMLESAKNEYLLFSGSCVGFGPQLVNRIKTANKLLDIIKERNNSEQST